MSLFWGKSAGTSVLSQGECHLVKIVSAIKCTRKTRKNWQLCLKSTPVKACYCHLPAHIFHHQWLPPTRFNIESLLCVQCVCKAIKRGHRKHCTLGSHPSSTKESPIKRANISLSRKKAFRDLCRMTEANIFTFLTHLPVTG